ncbi:hypothetical protein VN97_g11674, partial [Penicillium thymicola]
DKKTLYQLSY